MSILSDCEIENEDERNECFLIFKRFSFFEKTFKKVLKPLS